MVSKYGDEIEVDLHREYGVDLLDFFRGRFSWRKLYLLIQKLPSRALFHEAIADDREFAEQFIDAPQGSGAPRVSEYSQEVARLDLVVEHLAALTATVVAMAGGKPGRLKPMPRPETALTRLERERSTQRHNSLVDEVLQAQERWSARMGA